MSRTYKTDPLWVHLKKNRNGDFPVIHRHENGVCDPAPFDRENLNGYVWSKRCEPEFWYYRTSTFKYLPQRPLYSQYVRIEHRKARTYRKNMLAVAKKTRREDLEDFDYHDDIHRGAIWHYIY